jgi:hypothetical protein
MKTSTVNPSGAFGGTRFFSLHTVKPNRRESMSEYVSASTSGMAIHQASQLIENSHRQTM